jgi:hypothetical protein
MSETMIGVFFLSRHCYHTRGPNIISWNSFEDIKVACYHLCWLLHGSQTLVSILPSLLVNHKYSVKAPKGEKKREIDFIKIKYFHAQKTLSRPYIA